MYTGRDIEALKRRAAVGRGLTEQTGTDRAVTAGTTTHHAHRENHGHLSTAMERSKKRKTQLMKRTKLRRASTSGSSLRGEGAGRGEDGHGTGRSAQSLSLTATPESLGAPRAAAGCAGSLASSINCTTWMRTAISDHG